MKILVGITVLLGIILYAFVILFGHKFDATEPQIKETAYAQNKISDAVLYTFQDIPKIEVAIDYSVRAYIQKKSYMAVPYPYRAEAVASVGKTWCDNPGAFRFLLPKVVLRDLRTGEELACYRCCVWGNVSFN
jgi:threonyl-tRNA synthetase